MNIARHLITLLLAVVLASCGDDDNSEPPAELTDFTATLELNQRWSDPASDGVGQHYLFLTPLISGEMLINAGRDGQLLSIALKDGEILKRTELDTTLSAGIGGNDKLWLLATRNAEVIAVSAANAQVLWKKRVASEVLARPVLHKDAVLIRTVDGQIISLDAATGDIRWSYKQSLPALTLRGSSEPILSRDHIFVGLDNGRLVALAAANGEVVWDVALTVPEGRSEIQRLVDIDGHAELYGRILYASSFQGRLVAIDVERGQFLWARPFSSYSGVTLDEKALYVTDDRSHVWAIDRFSGATLWKQDALTARDVTRPVVMGDYLVVGDFDGYIHLLSRFDGHFVARTRVGEQDIESITENNGILVPPIVHAKQLLVTTRDGSVYAYTYSVPDASQDSSQ
ncbi:MAG: outer membrane protein assembly factor BamB [Gammaproteobacteria bacterium]